MSMGMKEIDLSLVVDRVLWWIFMIRTSLARRNRCQADSSHLAFTDPQPHEGRGET